MAVKKTPDRITIDFSGLKDQIENYRTDNAWGELTFNGKVRTMIADLILLSQKVDAPQKESG